jgi:hypothetical protein
MTKFPRRWVPYLLSDAQEVARVERSREMLRILQSPKEDNVDGIAAGDEFWFPCASPASKMFAGSPADVILRVRQSLGANTNYDFTHLFNPSLNSRKRLSPPRD